MSNDDTNHTPARRTERVRHTIKARKLTVQSVTRVGSTIIRVRFTGDSLHDFVSASFDDHLKLMLPAPGQALVLPVAGPERLEFPEGAARPQMRDYTPRSFDTARGELDIEFALHGDGPAASWAAQAAPGQVVGIGGPRGSMVIPMDYAWHLLVGDDTALPAISRRIEELPAGSKVLAVIEIAEAGDQREFSGPAAADADVHWVLRDGQAGADALAGIVATLSLPPGEGFAWAAGEAQAITAVRRVLIEQHGLHKNQIKAAAYWKHGSVAHHANLED